MNITDTELLAILGKKEVALYLANKANAEMAEALKAAKAELEQRAAVSQPDEPSPQEAG